MICSVAVVNRY